MFINVFFNLEIKEKRNRRDFYFWGNVVSYWFRFIVLFFYYVLFDDRM